MAPVCVTQQARLLVGLAIVGAIPMTVGAILWLVGTVMDSAYHGAWSGTAGLGGVLLMAGLICGLALFLLAAASERWALPGSCRPSRKDPRKLTPLASPEQQAFLADPQPPEQVCAEPAPPPAHSGGQLPFFPAEPQFPPDEQWPDPEPPPPAHPAFPNG
jgi:hypothetical protein